MDARISDDLVRRIWAEYAEMPGLSLTVAQAARLWGLDKETCTSALAVLTSAGFLHENAGGRYARASDGRTTLPSLRMARAQAVVAAKRSTRHNKTAGGSGSSR